MRPANFVTEVSATEAAVIGAGRRTGQRESGLVPGRGGGRAGEAERTFRFRGGTPADPLFASRDRRESGIGVSLPAVRHSLLGDVRTRVVDGKETMNYWDQETPRFALRQGPTWLKIDAGTGLLSGIPDRPGKVAIVVTATIDREVRKPGRPVAELGSGEDRVHGHAKGRRRDPEVHDRRRALDPIAGAFEDDDGMVMAPSSCIKDAHDETTQPEVRAMADLGARRRCVFGVILAVLTTAQGQAQPPSYKTRPARYGVVVEKNVTITTRDGTRLAADLYRPAVDGKPLDGRFPTLLTRTPYNKNGRREGRYYAAGVQRRRQRRAGPLRQRRYLAVHRRRRQ